MEKELIEKLAEMLESPDDEMHNLVIEIFKAHSNNYRDYWLLRTIFSPSIFLDRKPGATLDFIYRNVLDPATVDPWYNLVKREIGSDRKLGREELIRKSCVLATKEEQRDARKRSKYAESSTFARSRNAGPR